jgi:hypothetical protein
MTHYDGMYDEKRRKFEEIPASKCETFVRVSITPFPPCGCSMRRGSRGNEYTGAKRSGLENDIE